MNRYDKAFKEEAVRLSDEMGSKKAAEQLGVSYYTLQEWSKRKTLHGDGAHMGNGRALMRLSIRLHVKLVKEVCDVLQSTNRAIIVA